MKIQNLKHTVGIVVAIIAEQAKAEKAYVINFLSDLASTGLYTITYIMFLDLLMQRAGIIAGYTKNDLLFTVLIGQMTFYVVATCLAGPMQLLIDNVRTGYFDLILLKPVATRTYLYARALKPLATLVATVPNVAILVLLVHWGDLQLNIASLVLGVIVWICGLFIFNLFVFLLTLPVFSKGDASDLLGIYLATMATTDMPYQQLPRVMKFLSFVVLPALLMTAGSAAIILNKASPWPIIIPAIGAAAVAVIVFDRLWKRALRNYASASS